MILSPELGGAPHADERPTIRDVARVLNIAAATVSRALRNNPNVSAEMRARVLQTADKLGYRPDPAIAKLMYHLRSSRKARFNGVIAAITTRPPDERETYTDAITAGARRAADALGYAFELLHIKETATSQRALRRMLESRGVEGVVLLPMARPLDLAGLLDWRRFAVVAATGSVLAPSLHRVAPNHFANTKLLCARLGALGYRRIGLVVRAQQDVRVNHSFSAAVTWHNTYQGCVSAPPLIFDALEELNEERFQAWRRRARPDAIIATDQDKCRLLSQLLAGSRGRRIGLASTSTSPGSAWAGIDEQPGQVGATSVEVLAGMIQRGTRDVPVSPLTTTVEGTWHPGASCPPRAEASVERRRRLVA